MTLLLLLFLLLLNPGGLDDFHSVGATDQALRIQYSAKHFLTILQCEVLTAFCIRIYRAGRKLSSFKPWPDSFQKIPFVDNTIVLQTAFSCRMLVSSSCRCVYFLELLGGGAVEVVTVGNCSSVKHASCMVLSNVTITIFYLFLLLSYVSVVSPSYCWPKNACQHLVMRWYVIHWRNYVY
jgi:hypothetical protein